MTPPTPPTPATTPDDDLAGIVSLIRQRAKALLDDGFTTAAESDVIDAPLALRVADHLESLAATRAALAACRAARERMREVIEVIARADVEGESVGNQILIVKARNALAALADADRAGTGGG
jgi:hypothetical protein